MLLLVHPAIAEMAGWAILRGVAQTPTLTLLSLIRRLVKCFDTVSNFRRCVSEGSATALRQHAKKIKKSMS
jgi:hypothetical protein